MTAIAIDNDQVRISSHEYQTLIDSLIRARDKLLELAGECSGCNGTGVVTLQERRRGLTVERQVDCEECGDIRECLR